MKDTSAIVLLIQAQAANVFLEPGLDRKAEMRTLILAERRPVPREFSKTHAGE